jgi:SAM-dependent methyltransferase
MSWRVATAYLEDIFAQIPDSSIDDFRKDTPAEERRLINASHGETGLKDDNAHVYGEPAPLTSDLMLKGLGAGADDVIYDLGCGRGFFLMQALMTTPIRKAVGVELSASRVNIGKQARQMLLDQGLLIPGKELELREQDMAKTNMDDATLVYMDSVFYSDDLLNTVIRTMARARNMRTVVMIQKGLPANPWFELDRTERLKMSWSPRFGTDVMFYKRTAVPAE